MATRSKLATDVEFYVRAMRSTREPWPKRPFGDIAVSVFKAVAIAALVALGGLLVKLLF